MTPPEVLRHLASRLPVFEPSKEPLRLPGGLLNQVWRVEGAPHNVVVKHAPPHIATAPEVRLDAGRIVFEARALRDLDAGGRLAAIASDEARPPRPLHFDEDAHVLVMEDLGDLPALFEAREGERLESSAACLGHFVGRLHRQSAGRVELAEDYRNTPIQLTRREVQYRSMGAWLAHAGVDEGVARQAGARAEALGERLLGPGICLVMGDLWPLSVRLQGGALRLIDWEFTHYGQPLQDTAHLAAHACLAAQLAKTPDEREQIESAWRAFVRAYTESAAPLVTGSSSKEVRADFAAHFAAELLTRSIGAFATGPPLGAAPSSAPARRRALDEALRALGPEGPGLWACPSD